MPLVDIYLKLDYRMGYPHSTLTMNPLATQVQIKGWFAEAIPRLLVENANFLRLEPDTHVKGVQVMSHDFGDFDQNIPDIWVKIQFSEACPAKTERDRIRDRLYEILMGWFDNAGYLPGHFVLDIFWGPTSGKGIVDGRELMW